MEIKTSPEAIFAEYHQAQSYNQECNGGSLYERVRQNENFFVGNQWEGVNAPDLDKPVMNILRRVVSYFVSSIVSDDVGAELSVFGGASDEMELSLKIVSEEITAVIENTKAKAKNRDIIRNAAVDGDACLYINFNPTADTGQDALGGIEVEVLDNTDVYFGNPQVWEVQRQPWIIVQSRRLLEEARDEGRENGIPEAELLEIGSDDDPYGINTEQEKGKVTVLTKFWKQDGVVWFCKAAGPVLIKKPERMDLKLYPLAWLSWEKIKNSYHGQAAVTGLIPNQIFVNKLFAMCMEHVKKMAFPKVIYDRRMFPEGYTNRVGEAIGVVGPPSDAVAKGVSMPDMSSQVMQLIDKVIDYTRDTMGASDAALGNVNPDNTSAIIAVQKASAMPLELQRMAFYQFVEDYIRIFIDFMRVRYGVRQVTYEDESGQAIQTLLDFGVIDRMHYKLNVNIGASTYWSEIMQMQTLDNLMTRQIISDPALYLESIPAQYLPNKQKLLNHIKEQQDTAMMAQQMGGTTNGALPGV